MIKTFDKWARNAISMRLVVGILAAFLLLLVGIGAGSDKKSQVKITPASLTPQRKTTPHGPFGSAPEVIVNPDRITELAKTDHIALLKWSLEAYQIRVIDYTTTFNKQERIKGKLKKTEQISVMFKDIPFSVFMNWQKNAGSANKLLYVEGSNNNKMIVHPTGLFSWIKSVKKDPCGKDAQKASRRTCDQFGFRRSMKSLLEVYELAQKRGDLKIIYRGPTTIDGRPCIAMERILPPDKGYPAARMIMEFDQEYLLPVSITHYDWQNNLLGRYVFLNLKFNNGLTNARFLPKAHGM
ncbi:DUF1571 domain-containing protein [Planctomycetota bacterium]